MKASRISLILFLLCVLYGGLNLYNGRFEMRDLQVYYDAAEQLLDKSSPYGQAFGLTSGFYKYSPIAALLFTPFHLIGWMATRVIFFLLIAATMSYGLPKMANWLSDRANEPTYFKFVAIVLSALSIAGHFSRELLLGNVNWLLLLLLLFAFETLRKKKLLAGALIGLALLFKPHFAILIPWLIFRKEGKALVSMTGTLIIGLLLPAVYLGWSNNAGFIGEWLTAMLDHNGGIDSSPNTLQGLIGTITGFGGSGIFIGSVGVVALLFLFWMLGHLQKEKESPELIGLNRLTEYCVLLAVIPNLVHTDTEHFMWTLPLIMLMFLHLKNPFAVRNWTYLVVWFFAIIPFTLTTPDIWGQTIAEWFDKSGVLGIANLVLIGVSLIVIYSRNKSLKTAHNPTVQ